MLSFAEELMGLAHLESIGQSVNVGIGRVYPNCHQTFHSLLEAERAIQKMLLKKGQARVLHFDDLGIYRMQRIKEIGNMDLNDPNVALNVHIAIKILDLIPFELNTPKNLKRR